MIVKLECPACYEGKLICSNCAGNGTRYPERPGSMRCWQCKGTGEVACGKCGGTGEIEIEPDEDE